MWELDQLVGVRGVMWGSWGFGWNYCRKWCFVCELVEGSGEWYLGIWVESLL